MRFGYEAQSDSQTEVVNKSVEAYLHCFCRERPKQWQSWLHWAEYCYNTTFNISIGITPFQAVYGCAPLALVYYGDQPSSNSDLDQLLWERDVMLGV